METRLPVQPNTAPPPSYTDVRGGLLQRECACGGSAGVTGSCDDCDNQKLSLQRSTGNSEVETRSSSRVPPIVHEVLRSQGLPLDAETRAFMEPRFGHDFGHVRVHADADAAESARAVNALAYTVGHDLVFGYGQHAPQSLTGQRLLAHELTHVIQQRATIPQSRLEIGEANDSSEQEADEVADVVMRSSPDDLRSPTVAPLSIARVQRACGGAALGQPTPDCTRRTQDASGEVFHFIVNCDDLESGEEEHLQCFAIGLPPGSTVMVHGFASSEGDEAYNWRLSCHRANKISTLIHRFRPDLTLTSPNFKHGATTGPASDRRSAIVETTVPTPVPTGSGICGPEATNWFVTQVNMAMSDVAVLAVRSHMMVADILARSHGTTAQAVAEGGVAARIVQQVASMTIAGTPPPSTPPAPTAQIALGTAAGTAAASTLASHPSDALTIATEINTAAGLWRILVNHGARYDFKAHTMQNPRTPCCPVAPCTSTITLCAGPATENCYLTDLPGNLFYALIGRFVGFSERTLQLGSEFAQLTGTGAWDPPQDTAAITIGFALPLPLSSGGLCSLLVPLRGGLNTRPNCRDCQQLTTAGFR